MMLRVKSNLQERVKYFPKHTNVRGSARHE